MVFMASPDSAIEVCGDAEFCAVQDQGLPKKFFNAGFLVIRPSSEILQRFMAHSGWGRGPNDQDFINEWFRESWKELDVKYNCMPFKGKSLGNEARAIAAAVALHEKWWRLRSHLTDPKYIWNQVPLTTGDSTNGNDPFRRK